MRFLEAVDDLRSFVLDVAAAIEDVATWLFAVIIGSEAITRLARWMTRR